MIWDDYPGVQGLLLKGLTSPQLYEDSIKLIGRLTPHASSPLYYPTQSLGLPRNVLLLLPVFVVNFSHQDERAKQFASVIAQVLLLLLLLLLLFTCCLLLFTCCLLLFTCCLLLFTDLSRPVKRRLRGRRGWTVWVLSSRCTPSRATTSRYTCG